MKHLVFFASGSGTNFQAVIDAIDAHQIEAQISGLITNKNGIGAIHRAKNNDIPVKIISPDHPNFADELLKTLQAWQPDLIVLAGYMCKIPPAVIDHYPKRIINIHPSLLPEFGGKGFYGMKVHEAVIEAGKNKSGCSVHLVTKEYDQGPVLGQRTVPVHEADTPEVLASRVLEQEHHLLPEIIKNYLPKL